MAETKHAPDSLKYQWRLLGLVMRSEWATGLDKSIAFQIIDNYRKDKADSRASLRYLQQATGAERSNVIASLRRLVERGPFSVGRLGAGTRPTEYKLHFDLVAENASGIAGDTTSHDLLSGIAGDTSCGIAANTASGASGIAGDTESVLRTRPTAGVQEDGNMNTPDTPLPGLAAGTGSRDPERAFDRFWSGYPRKYQKPKARAAWDKLAPDAELAERIVGAASLWADHYTDHPVDKKWIPTPANWLAGERYDEDLPSVYADPKEAAFAKTKDRPKARKAKPVHTADDEPFQPRRDLMRILLADFQGGWLNLVMVDADDNDHDLNICLESANEGAQIRGQCQFNHLLAALNMPECSDSSELIGKTFFRVLPSKFAEYEFEADPANDSDSDIDYDWKPEPRVERPPVKFVPKFSVVPKAEKEAREMAREWAAKFNDDDGEEQAA